MDHLGQGFFLLFFSFLVVTTIWQKYSQLPLSFFSVGVLLSLSVLSCLLMDAWTFVTHIWIVNFLWKVQLQFWVSYEHIWQLVSNYILVAPSREGLTFSLMVLLSHFSFYAPHWVPKCNTLALFHAQGLESSIWREKSQTFRMMLNQ